MLKPHRLLAMADMPEGEIDGSDASLPRACRKSGTLLVVAGALCRDGTVLISHRHEGKPMGGMWEFPGGKVEFSEDPEEALARELLEELGISVKGLRPISFATHEDMVLLLFRVETWDGEPRGNEGQSIEWVDVDALEQYVMPRVDAALLAPLRTSLLIE